MNATLVWFEAGERQEFGIKIPFLPPAGFQIDFVDADNRRRRFKVGKANAPTWDSHAQILTIFADAEPEKVR